MLPPARIEVNNVLVSSTSSFPAQARMRFQTAETAKQMKIAAIKLRI
jgi:hypothetical protein